MLLIKLHLSLTHTHAHTLTPALTCIVLFWLLKQRSCIKLCRDPAQSRQTQWSIALDQNYISSSIHHQNYNNTTLTKCFRAACMLSPVYLTIKRDLQMSKRETLHKTDSPPWEQRQLRKKKWATGMILIYMELFILCVLFTDASHDTSQLRGFASAALRRNAQLTMKGIPRMDGLLIN